jgi:hypothetical protein
MIRRNLLVLCVLLAGLAVMLSTPRRTYACTTQELQQCRSAEVLCESECDGSESCITGCVDEYVACIRLCS